MAKASVGGHVAAIASQYKVSHDDFFSMLIVVPESVESHECLNILNFFGFPIKDVGEDNVIKRKLAQEMGFAKDDEYPLLLIESA